MNHPTHIRLIDAHTESNSGTYYLHPIINKVFLCLVSGGWGKSGMISRSFHPMADEHFGYLLRLVPTHAIHDATFVRSLEDELQDGACLFFLLITSAYIEAQVWSVERRDECLRIFQCQLLDYILSCYLVGRCRQCHNGRLRKLLTKDFQLGIFRSEVVSPLGDTMRFVNGKKRYLDFS